MVKTRGGSETKTKANVAKTTRASKPNLAPPPGEIEELTNSYNNLTRQRLEMHLAATQNNVVLQDQITALDARCSELSARNGELKLKIIKLTNDASKLEQSAESQATEYNQLLDKYERLSAKYKEIQQIEEEKDINKLKNMIAFIAPYNSHSFQENAKIRALAELNQMGPSEFVNTRRYTPVQVIEWSKTLSCASCNAKHAAASGGVLLNHCVKCASSLQETIAKIGHQKATNIFKEKIKRAYIFNPNFKLRAEREFSSSSSSSSSSSLFSTPRN